MPLSLPSRKRPRDDEEKKPAHNSSRSSSGAAPATTKPSAGAGKCTGVGKSGAGGTTLTLPPRNNPKSKTSSSLGLGGIGRVIPVGMKQAPTTAAISPTSKLEGKGSASEEQGQQQDDTAEMTLNINDRMGKKIKVVTAPTSTMAEVKKLIAQQQGHTGGTGGSTGTSGSASASSGGGVSKGGGGSKGVSRYRLQRANMVLRDHITIEDYELTDGCTIDLYYD